MNGDEFRRASRQGSNMRFFQFLLKGDVERILPPLQEGPLLLTLSLLDKIQNQILYVLYQTRRAQCLMSTVSSGTLPCPLLVSALFYWYEASNRKKPPSLVSRNWWSLLRILNSAELCQKTAHKVYTENDSYFPFPLPSTQQNLKPGTAAITYSLKSEPDHSHG